MTALEIRLADEAARHVEGVTEQTPKKLARPRKGAPTLEGKPASLLAPIANLVRDPAINCRAGVSEKVANEYAEVADELPPVVAFKDPEGSLWLADGFHRCRAHELAGRAEIRVDVHEGDRRAAILFAAGCNTKHGVRRTNADKRRAVLALLADPEWVQWSDRVIADRCGVNHELVGTLRSSTGDSASSPRRGKDGKVRRSPKKGNRSGFRRIPAAYRLASRALGKLSMAWARKQPIDALLAEVRRALEELERQHGAEDAR